MLWSLSDLMLRLLASLMYSREVYDVPLAYLSPYGITTDGVKWCDVCIDDGIDNQPTVIYCLTCPKTYCTKHNQVSEFECCCQLMHIISLFAALVSQIKKITCAITITQGS